MDEIEQSHKYYRVKLKISAVKNDTFCVSICNSLKINKLQLN